MIINIIDSDTGALKVIPIDLIKRIVAPNAGGIQLELTTKRKKITDTTKTIVDIYNQMAGYGIIVTNTKSQLTEQREVYPMYAVKEIIEYQGGSKLTLESYQLDVICSETVATIAGQNVEGFLRVVGTRNIQKGTFQPKDHLIPDHRTEMITDNVNGFAEVYFLEGLYPIDMEVSTPDYITTGPLPVPQLQVQVNGNTVASGSTVDFSSGAAPIFPFVGSSFSALLDVSNIGGSTLTVTTFTVSGDVDGSFVPISTPIDFPPSSGFTIPFDTSSAGVKTINITIESNDPSVPTFTLTLQVTVV